MKFYRRFIANGVVRTKLITLSAIEPSFWRSLTFAEVRRSLVQRHPASDEPTLSGTLEGAIDFKEAIAALVQSALRYECLASALRDQMAHIRARRFIMGSVIGGPKLVFVSTTQLDRAKRP